VSNEEGTIMKALPFIGGRFVFLATLVLSWLLWTMP